MKKSILVFGAIFVIWVATFVSAQTEQADSNQPEPVVAEPAIKASLLTVDAKICSGIEERQPTGVADRFDPGVEKVFLWSKISGATDSIMISHVWLYEGKEMAVVDLPVKSASWRAWSSKKILPSWTGEWEARVVGPDGVVMATTRFTIAAEPQVEEKETE
ncbi:MAG: DUF2914 domain-containing protein [FCB group bacterium]|nr:DUF2914 domain-containing protein [FCB group bacterium]